MGFMSFLLSRDLLGHSISVNYRGETTFNTKLGAFFSVCIQILVFVQLAEKVVDLVLMNDPTI